MNPKQLLEWLIWNEGYYTQIYTDILGNSTIGIGFLLKNNASIVNGILGPNMYNNILNGATLSDKQIMALFNYSINQAIDLALSTYPNLGNFSNVEQIVLTDFAFDNSPAKISLFEKMNDAINSNPPNWNQAANQLQNSLWYNQVGGRGPRDVNALKSNSFPTIPQSIINKANSLINLLKIDNLPQPQFQPQQGTGQYNWGQEPNSNFPVTNPPFDPDLSNTENWNWTNPGENNQNNSGIGAYSGAAAGAAAGLVNPPLAGSYDWPSDSGDQDPSGSVAYVNDDWEFGSSPIGGGTNDPTGGTPDTGGTTDPTGGTYGGGTTGSTGGAVVSGGSGAADGSDGGGGGGDYNWLEPVWSGEETGYDSATDPWGSGFAMTFTPLGCFAKGTLVSTAEGLIPIELVKLGDSVYAHDPELKGTVLEPVTKIFQSESDQFIVLDFGSEKIQCTKRHRFYTGQWIPAEELKIGDLIMDRNGEWNKLEGKQEESGLQQIVNFTINRLHNYFVGNKALLVHNMKDIEGGGGGPVIAVRNNSPNNQGNTPFSNQNLTVQGASQSSVINENWEPAQPDSSSWEFGNGEIDF